MKRRELLKQSLSAATLVGLAGCVYQNVPIGDESTTDVPAPTTGAGTVNATTQAEATEGETDVTTTLTTESATESGGQTVAIDVGPDGAYFRFDPDRVEISVGDTVEWTARSEGHNVSAYPDDARQVELPERAEPFGSFPAGESYRIIPVGESFRHTLTVPGEYVYVCVPHVGEGMIGRVIVSD